MSEYTQRYQHVSHRELYDAVRAGDPQQVEGLASQWSSLRETLDNLARDLDTDLDKLAPAWTGDAAREFHDRLSLVVRYSTELAEGAADVRQALNLMAGQLRTAQQKAESPEATDDHDKAIDGATKGAMLGVPGMIVGGIMGHQQDKAEQEKAHQRMVEVVADLAAGYEVARYGRIVDPPAPPTRLPGDADRSGVPTQHGPAVNTPASAPTTGAFGPGGGATATTAGSVSQGPGTASGGAGTGGEGSGGATTGGPGVIDAGTGTSLAGAGPATGGVGGGSGLAGASPTTTGGPGTGSGSMFGGAAGLVAGGVLGTGALASSGSRAAATTPSRPGAPTGMENRSAAGTGRLASGQPGAGGNDGRAGARAGSANRAAMAGGAGRSGVIGGRGQHGEDDSDERMTWLTEDEMVWGDGGTTAPPVLGGDR
ncbi:WXG100 family type VII secretion target [Micromonospora halophytica]|uniref:Proteins of 100 residues with WXG n=1 Tax=Micromonospora halophytica TaxID=47864 RepID=A0A1C5IW29_9ACTN|nr:WXG100 family type VII secretion target [Micromonospora halophytica]SCG62567.1 Proteins of 100 residues with WXG [Micromonospora halophytica]